MRFFNTAGPVNPEKHYCLPPLHRWNLDEVLSLIEQEKYFVLHAPRQTGKTSCLLALVEHLNQTGRYRALYANVESGQSARENVKRAMRAILSEVGERARDYLDDPSLLAGLDQVFQEAGEDGALRALLTRWASSSSQPIVLMLDEIDSLVGDTLISVLRQLRSGYDKRPTRFPLSVILCGVRDVRDYRIHSSAEKSIITGGSAFNIRAESLRLGDFSRADIEELYAQHTEVTGQVFEPGALDTAWDLSSGQPWVVNALAYETCFRMDEGKDRSQPITPEMMQQASENLILNRETHLDQLADKLREPRVRRVIEPILAGESLPEEVSDDDLEYVVDLGLIRRGSEGPQVANGIYREIIPRQLTTIVQANLEALVRPGWYVRPDGSLDMDGLLQGFQEFFRENSEHWSRMFDYQEAWPQLLLQAYLQRVANGGGQIHREYGLGRGRTDLLIVWPLRSPGQSSVQSVARPPVQRAVIELKVVGGPRWKGALDTVVQKGLRQTAEYLDRMTMGEGHLVVFDRTADKPWEEKIWRREEHVDGKSITVWGM